MTIGNIDNKTGKEKMTLNEMLEGIFNRKSNSEIVKALAESVGASTAATQKFLTKNGHLPAPSLSELTKSALQNPGLARILQGCTSNVVMQATAASKSNETIPPLPKSMVEPQGTLPFKTKDQDTNTLLPKPSNPKRKNKKKVPEDASLNKLPPLPSTGLANVLKPRNFLEAALYFSTITSSTVEMAIDLEPEYFFAPPFLFQRVDETESWLANLRRPNARTASIEKEPGKEEDCLPLSFEKLKVIQVRTIGLFAVALLQTAQHLKPTNNADRNNCANVSLKSNYFKRTIGLYAISLVDHLPTSLTCRLLDSGGRPMTTSGGYNSQGEPRLLFKSNPLLANRKLELNDLKVPTAEQLSNFWASLTGLEQATILRAEQSYLQKGWINTKKTFCLCKYCRTRALRLGDIYELLYRAYYDDLERVALECDQLGKEEKSSPLTDSTFLKGKTRKHLYKALSLLADDISDERGAYLIMILKRLGRAFEDDHGLECSEEDHNCEKLNSQVPTGSFPHNLGENGKSCDGCSQGGSAGGFKTTLPTKSNNNTNIDELPDAIDDSTDEDNDSSPPSDCWDEEELETFYEDFNMMEDEEVIQAECELPVDVAHLATSFPTIYDPRIYNTMSPPPPPPPSIPPNYTIKNETERIADGNILYESLASLLFQFHLVPRYLEAEALARQRRLLQEEEEQELLEKERAEAKLIARKQKKERKRAAKLLRLEQQDTESTAQAKVTTTAQETGGEGEGLIYSKESSPSKVDSLGKKPCKDNQGELDEKDNLLNSVKESFSSMNSPEFDNFERLKSKMGVDFSSDDVDSTPPGLTLIDDVCLLPPPELSIISKRNSLEPPLYNVTSPLTIAAISPTLKDQPEDSSQLSKVDSTPPPVTPLIASPGELYGEAPPTVPTSWFERILRSDGTCYPPLWNPLAIQSKLTGEEVPPGFSCPPIFTEMWSPFTARTGGGGL